MNVPYLDLTTQYENIAAEIDGAIQSVIDETAFVRGRFVAEFERDFAAAHGARHCIGVGNGTDALFIALKMLDIGPGDEVITAANSWIATSEVISLAGAEPRFVDIEPDYFNIDPARIAAAATKRTKAILPVHLYGQAADMVAIAEIAEERGWAVVEDCAQAHMAKLEGRAVGRFGVAGTFSFYPGKNLGAFGDAGCIITDDDQLAERMRSFANHGSSPQSKHDHAMEGMNSRLDGIQAAVLSVKLRYLSEWTRRRAHWASRYSELLASLPEVATPAVRPGASHVFHVYCIRAKNRDSLRKRLGERGIATGIHYPTPLPFLEAYKRYGHRAAEFPVSYAYQDTILSLPIYPELTEDVVTYVADSIIDFYS